MLMHYCVTTRRLDCPTTWLHDSECDPGCYNEACEYDGGDCCGAIIDCMSDYYSTGCACLDPTSPWYSPPAPAPTQQADCCTSWSAECYHAIARTSIVTPAMAKDVNFILSAFRYRLSGTYHDTEDATGSLHCQRL